MADNFSDRIRAVAERAKAASAAAEPSASAPAETANQSEAAASTLRDSVARPVLRVVAEALGWRQPWGEDLREGTTNWRFAKVTHKYGGSLAALTVRVTSDAREALDLRVTCELAETEIYNAERIVGVEGMDADGVYSWLEDQVERCIAELLPKVDVAG